MSKETGTLRERLKTRLRDVRLTQRELADRIGIENQQNITHWMKSGTIPAERLFDVARTLGCNPEWLLTGRGSEDASSALTVDAGALTKVILGVLDGTAKAEIDLSPHDTAKLVARVYAMWEESNQMPDFEMVIRFARFDLAENS